MKKRVIMEKKIKIDVLKLVLLLLYFLILTAERIISLVTVFTGDFSGYDCLDWYMTVLTVLSIIGSYCYMLKKCSFKVKRFENGKVSAYPALENDNFGRLSIAAGILLLGGMVHTDGSIPPLQFVSYGMILASMAVHAAQCAAAEGKGLKKWLSFAYVVAFSMAIPVVYHSAVQLAWLFIPVEIIVSAGMVIIFTAMLRRFYLNGAENDFALLPLAAAFIGDAAVLALRWTEEINWFVLIFICVATLCWILGKSFCGRKKV